MNWSSVRARLSQGGFAAAFLIFLAVLIFLFYEAFLPNEVLFSNDGPLGRLMSRANHLPGRFSGCWADLNNIGFSVGAATPSISFGLQMLLGPVWFSKLYTIISLLILAVGAWCYFRQLKLAPAACILGALATVLNSTFFSLACWGLGAQVITAGMFFLALAALSDTTSPRRWLLWILAGFAVGMVVVEGADVGAIFSLLIAGIVIYQALIAEGPRIKNLATGFVRLTIVVILAAFMAVETVNGLLSSSVEGVAGTQQDAQTKAQRWNWATQWSLPKTETLGLIVPGLFGYRLDTPSGGEYWGFTGHDAAWDKYYQDGQKGQAPSGFYRYTGGGNYVGVLVALIAFWAAAQSLRLRSTLFTLYQKKWLWFWLALSIISLLLALGRYAPFYHVIYMLPYFSTIRNPTKFLYVFSFGIVILFSYGVDALWRRYLKPSGNGENAYWGGIGRWWSKTGPFDKNWVYGCGLVWALALIAWYIYYQHLPDLEQYLQTNHLDQPASKVAAFSVAQPVWFVVYFFFGATLFTLILSGAFAGKRAGTAVLLLGVLLVSDLAIADRPWIVSWNYPYKYMSNPVIDLLREKPYEHRAVLAPITFQGQMSLFRTVYKTEWMEQQFPYYNVQTFDVVELPRIPVDFSIFSKKINQYRGADSLTNYSRAYQLTNTRYILAPADFDTFWNSKLPQTPLQSVMRFNILPKPGLNLATNVDQVTAVLDSYGTYAVFEMPSTLPRAKLYSHWEVDADDTNVLGRMFNQDFDPHNTVFVSGGVPDNTTTNVANPPDDAVQFVNYAPKDIVFKTEAAMATVLLLNDRFQSDWKVLVDGQPEKLLRCNFIMRGVYLPSGQHTVEFEFKPQIGLLYVSLTAVIIALVVLGIYLVSVIKSLPPVPKPVVPSPLAPAQAKVEKSKSDSRKKAQRK
jgi:hypothetical protein